MGLAWIVESLLISRLTVPDPVKETIDAWGGGLTTVPKPARQVKLARLEAQAQQQL
jgi:hypothetical protein